MFDNIAAAWPELIQALLETLYMLILTLPIAVAIGTPLGTILFLTRPDSFLKWPKFYLILNGFVNLIRSFPFLILMIAIIPFTRLVVGTALGTTAATVPMIINAVPYFARFIEQILLDVNRGVVEAAESMGQTNFRSFEGVIHRSSFWYCQCGYHRYREFPLLFYGCGASWRRRHRRLCHPIWLLPLSNGCDVRYDCHYGAVRTSFSVHRQLYRTQTG